MTDALRAFVGTALVVPLRPEITRTAKILAQRSNAVAVLFYGSVLRSGDLDGILDFYVLTDGEPKGLADRWLWPTVGFVEITTDARTVRAKVATMPLALFRKAAGGELLDTTIWTRFVQPSALAWKRDRKTEAQVTDAIAAATTAASEFAALHGGDTGNAEDFWRALFANTYTLEFRVERPGRDRQIVTSAPDWFAGLLPLAWDAAGIAFERDGAVLAPTLSPARRRTLARRWKRRRRLGKARNAARLIKAAFTFDGATRYALWKIARHTGVRIAPTPWRERHPILAAPGVLWRVWRRSEG